VAAAPSSGRGADMPRGHGELILVVDDEPSILNTTRQTLEAFGYRVVTAPDGSSAVLEFSRKKSEISVVITDVSMPGMDGVETSRALMAIEPAVKIILVSGLEDRLETASAMSVKKLHTIAKPFSTFDLLSMLQKLIGLSAKPG
jgi:CheY-like chemotaxis protein